MADEVRSWFVRVIDTHISVGIFCCRELELADLIDVACDAEVCEYKALSPGGFIFGGAFVLHQLDPEADDHDDHITSGWITDNWMDVYRDEGPWERINSSLFHADNDRWP